MMGIITLLVMILSLQRMFAVNGDNFSDTYKATENILVNCGSSTSVQLGERRATPDNISSPQFSLIQNPLSLSIQANSSSLNNIRSSVNYVLYTTARLSRSEFTYSFLVTEGPKFVRLHFYPSSYSNFDRYSSLFSVKSGPFTLLKDFNASLTADNDDDSRTIVFREYCIKVQRGEQRLNVTFIPNTAMSLHAYAFINGIEVVSVPSYLYYTKPEDRGFYIVGHSSLYQIESNMALETMYRINAGGRQISPDQDTGMFRRWDEEEQYSTEYGLTRVYFGPDKLRYTQISNYSAPEEVYRTGLSCGPGERAETYNVTREFEVDSQFLYLVRLHFCDIMPYTGNTSEVFFQIFIADKLAQHHADVLLWAQGNPTPYYKDYAVWMLSNDQKLKKLNLSIKLQPYDGGDISLYRDVILNGIEIFKISDANSNLQGPNPDPRLNPYSPQINSQKPRTSNKRTKIFVVAGTTSGLILLSIIFLIIWQLRTRIQYSAATLESNKHSSSSLPSDLCRCFSIAEIKAATNNFDDIFIIGVGGFGNVYKGYIDNNTLPVAIKRLKPGSQQGAQEFLTEIVMLSYLRHVHLVSLMGYCNEGDEMILVYEFMAHGTFFDHLYGSDCKEPLSWKQRLEVSLGAARGLHYLHSGAGHNIIHRDVKSTNILLDEKWVAKVSDFGLSKVGPAGVSRSHISTVVKGSVGYLDPEYYKRQRLTLKSDVYSFGVVLLEVLCGRRPLLRTVEKQKANLVDWFRRCHREGVIHETVDPFLIESITPECLKAFSDMALSCLADDGNERPSMNDVVWGLEFAMKLQESTEDPVMDANSGAQKEEEEETLLMKRVMEDDADKCSEIH
ncbi:receptor-like protein kinase FERONIA [Neltuma alba]|uniref:receptor-like protein kinase FERONIA n=1 Tax=Neltuma alba TaxID=207710 RepID=UPI0010A4745E|nr:receptor-like protein kinase FERONIA [Prosopis alba]